MTDVRSDDRGQLLLIAAVVMAFALIGLVAVFNAVLYTENVAPQGATTAADEVEHVEQTTSTDLEQLLSEMSGNKSYVIADSIEPNVSAYDEHRSRSISTSKPAYFSVSLNKTESTNISVVKQDDGGSFHSQDGDGNWTIVEDGELEGFEANITNPPSVAGSGIGPFMILVESETTSDEWALRVYENDDDEFVVEADGSLVCEDGDATEIGLESGVGDELHVWTDDSCDEAVQFAEGVTEPYSISYAAEGASPQSAEGTYEIAVNGDVRDDNVNTGSTDPYLIEGIETATFDLRYETPELEFETLIEIEVVSS